jgi:hypothetical protein
MRSPLTALRRAVPAAAAAVLLTACGGSGDEEPVASSPAAEASPPEAGPSPTPDPEAAGFCEEATAALDELTETLDTATEEDIGTRLPEVVSTLQSVEAPPAVEADWGALADGLGQLADTASSVDLTTPEGQQEYADAQSRLGGDIATAQENATNYVISNCSVETAAPTG